MFCWPITLRSLNCITGNCSGHGGRPMLSSRAASWPALAHFIDSFFSVKSDKKLNKTANETPVTQNQGADKSLARPGRKQPPKHFWDARDFNNIETRAVIKFFFPARQDAEGNSSHSDRNISLFPSWSG